MKDTLRQLLVDPEHYQTLVLEIDKTEGEEIQTGRLVAPSGVAYPIRDGIPRFVMTTDSAQLQTSATFGFKWKRRDTYDSPQMRQFSAEWLVRKYGFGSLADWAGYFDSRRTILDLGCGSGFSSSLWLDTPYWQGRAAWVGVDISTAIDTARERLADVANTHFIQADALHLPFGDASFDTIFSEGVLHHTPSTRDAIHSAVRVLEPSGEFHFYVYRRKAPIREFADDYIREAIAGLSDEEAWQAMRSLTQLGKALAELKAEIEIDDIPLLGIKAGKHGVQRLIYWHFAKIFWNSDLSFEENVHINFDWYRPTYAHRHTEEELRAWCVEAGLSIRRWHTEDSGFSVIAIKSAKDHKVTS